jgi:DNA replication and repair protein RecF
MLIITRRDAILELDRLARERYRWLSDEQETLRLYYAPSFDPDRRPRLDYQRPVPLEGFWSSQTEGLAGPDVVAAFLEALRQSRRQELARGLTLVGPHRDDLHFLVDGIDMTLYGSRGQQRSTALALKLAETDLMARVTGDPPVLLLDDVMSELDSGRRSRVVSAVEGVEQAILTATDWSAFSPDLLARSTRLAVSQGQLGPADL